MCTHIRVPAEKITRESLHRLDVRGVCLECWILANAVECWQHDGSECVWLADPINDPEQKFDLSCDELTTRQFFDRIAHGWSYDLMC